MEKQLDPVERVTRTLVGLADEHGFLAKFSREEVLDYAFISGGEFERALVDLVAAGRVSIVKIGANAPRRFQMHGVGGRERAQAIAYISEHRDRVTRLASRRVQVKAALSRQAVTSDEEGVFAGDFRVVGLKRDAGATSERYLFTLILAGLGSIRRCCYVVGRNRKFVVGPSERHEGKWVAIVEFTPEFGERVQRDVEAQIAAGVGTAADATP